MRWEILFKTDNRQVQRRSSRGFTLIEVMVALVITSLLVSVLVSALYYMFRVQDSLEREVVTRESDLRAKAWFADAVAGCLPVDMSAGSAFAGSEMEIRCETTAALQPAYSGVPTLVVFAIKRGQGDQMLLTYQEPAQKDSRPRVIAEWSASGASFRYVNIKGMETDRWPKNKTDLETLPRLVRLSVKTPDNFPIIWSVALRNDPWIEPPFKLPFGMEMLK